VKTFFQFLVTCKSFQGRHTGEAIGLATDLMVREIGLPIGTKTAMVTDSASNMIRGMKNSQTIDNHLLCLDHIINTCVNKALGVPDLKDLVEKVKRLAEKTHRSTLNNEKIKIAAESVGIPPKKIIQPVQTRWNSFETCVWSVVDLREAITIVVANEPSHDLSTVVPTVREFDILANLLKPLGAIKMWSERLSSDTKPTIHLVTGSLWTLTNLHKQVGGHSSDIMQAFVDSFRE